MSHTYETLQQVFAAVKTKVNAYLGYQPFFSYSSEVTQHSHLPPRSLVIAPQEYRYGPSVNNRGDGRKTLRMQTHSFAAVLWGNNEDDTWAIEGAFSAALLEIGFAAVRPIKGTWIEAANSRVGRAIQLEFEIDVPLLAPAPLTAVIETAAITDAS